MPMSEVCRRLGERRGKAIRLVAYPLEAPGPFGLWLNTPSADYILYQAETTPAHQQHIIAHELGHLLTAKMFGVKVTQYMVGFGRTIWSRKGRETEYGVKMIPFGGYIRMIGMFPPKKDEEYGRTASSAPWRAMIEDAR